MRRLLIIALFLEAGFVLVIVPWSSFWDRNYFATAVPVLHVIISNNFVRGAVSGLGLVNIATGIADLVSLFKAKKVDPSVAILASPTPDKE